MSVKDHDEHFDIMSDTPENTHVTLDSEADNHTVHTEMTELNEAMSQLSTESAHIPGAPFNSPENVSLADHPAYMSCIDGTSLVERLHAVPGATFSPPASVFGDRNKGKRAVHDPGRDLFSQIFKPSTPERVREARRKGRLLMKARAGTSSEASTTKGLSSLSTVDTVKEEPAVGAEQKTFEHSVWEELAEEDVTFAFARLARLARDEQQKHDPTRPVEEYYSIRLARLIAKAEIKFDPMYLKEV